MDQFLPIHGSYYTKTKFGLKYKLHYQKDPDICLEATACRLFAAEVSKYIKDSCKSILGAATYLSDNNVVAIFDDIEGMYN